MTTPGHRTAQPLKWITALVLLSGILIVVSLIALSVGSSGISFSRILSVISEGSGSSEYSILFKIRLPRIIMGLAIGGALSLSGALLQGMFRNPLVEPYTLGISGGAALGVCLCIILGIKQAIGIFSMPVFGFAGSLLVIILVYTLSLRRGILQINGLLLTGVMISFITSSLIMMIMSISRVEDLQGIIFWVMGSLEESNWNLIILAVIVSISGLMISYFFCMDLNAFALGEEEAQHLGIPIERTKRILFVLASALTGLSVSMAGIIGFVGLVVPHFVRMFIGSDHRILLAASFLSGASFLIICDTLARTIIAPLELPVGVITGILGGSLFVWALSKRGLVWER